MNVSTRIRHLRRSVPFAERLPWLQSPPFVELAILLLAAVVRLWRLDYHSIWFDEAVSLRWAGSDPRYIWDETLPLIKDKHPPGYYLLLHSWRQVMDIWGLGRDDVALRVLGSLLGVATVLAILLLAGRLSGRATGRLAGILVALAPLLVWYSQELRMFQPATTALVWAAYCLLRAWQNERWPARLGWWLGLVVAFELALYSYLFSAFMLPAAAVTLLALFLSARTRQAARPQSNLPEPGPLALTRFLEGCVAMAAAGLLFLPLARNAWLAGAGDGTAGQPFMDFLPNLWRQLRVATVWRVDWPLPWLYATQGFFAALTLLGLLLPLSGKGTASPHSVQVSPAPAPVTAKLDRGWLLIWIGVPLLIGNLLLARNDTIFAEDRYFLFLAPFVLWAVARGAVALAAVWRPAGWLLGGMAAMLLLAALPRLWTPSMLREDWRAASQYIADYQTASPGLPAAVVAHVDYTRLASEWYLRRRYDRESLPIYFPFGSTLAKEQMDEVIAPSLRGIQDSGVDTLWLLQSHLEGVDDAGLVEGWLNQQFPLVTEQYPTGVKLAGYALQSQFETLPAPGPHAVRPAVELAPGLSLAACEIVTPQVAAADERMHPPSGWVHVRLWWQATRPIAQDYMATVQMVGPEGVWGDRLYRDDEALRRWPTSTWSDAIFVRDEVDVNLNPVTPPGEYPIVVGVRDAGGQESQNKAECGRVRVAGTP